MMLLSIQREADLCDREARGYTTRANRSLEHLAQRYVAPFFKAVILFRVETAQIGFVFELSSCYFASPEFSLPQEYPKSLDC